MDLTEKLIQSGKHNLSISILFMLAQNPGVSEIHPKLQELAWISLVDLSEQKIDGNSSNKAISDFENFIPQLVSLIRSRSELSKTGITDQYHTSSKHKQDALVILSNLALKDTLRGQIGANQGIQLFLDVIKGTIPQLNESIPAERAAAKGLLNMALAKQETRHMIIA
jgi:hypothetical protein